MQPLTYTGINAFIMVGAAFILRLWIEGAFRRAQTEWASKQKVLAERRGEAVCRVYSLISEVRREVREYTSESQVICKEAADQRTARIATLFTSLRNYFEDHQLFFDDDVAESIHKFLRFTIEKTGAFSLFVVQPEVGDELSKDRTTNWVRIAKEVKSEGELLLGELRSRFRALIGTTNSSERS